MKNIISYLLFVMFIVALYGFSFSFNNYGDPEGQKVFVDKKCGTCHTVNSANLTSKKKDASDLSNAGAKGNSELLTKYLTKKEKLDGKEHKTAFKGTDEELASLTKWLASLKTTKAKN